MTVRIITGDCREKLAELPAESVHCVVTSPPYFGLRDYGVVGQIGLEPTPDEYVSALMGILRQARRVLRSDATCWLNLGDSYASSVKGINSNGEGGSTLTSGARPHVRAAYNDGRGRDGHVVDCGVPAKNLLGIPWRVAFALQSDGWYLRQDIIWSKPNPMPESVRDRCTKAHEYIFLLSKSERYYYDADAIAEAAIYSGLANQDDSGFKNPQSFNGKHKDGYRSSPPGRASGEVYTAQAYEHPQSEPRGSRKNFGDFATRNKRSVWEIATNPFPEAHFATFPPALIEPCILAGCPKGGTVLDPFGGAGTTGLVADRLGRNAILIELNPEYADMAQRRIKGDTPMFTQVAAE